MKHIFTLLLEFQGHVSCSNTKSHRMLTFLICLLNQKFIYVFLMEALKKCSSRGEGLSGLSGGSALSAVKFAHLSNLCFCSDKPMALKEK